jgi:hypothetical protein
VLEQGVGSHFDPFASCLKFGLVMYGVCRYLGSSTTAVTASQRSPFASLCCDNKDVE